MSTSPSKPMSQGRKERNTVLALLAAELCLIGFFLAALWHERWANAGLTLSLMVAIPCWAIIVKVPTACGVYTRKKEPCPNQAYGILVGCTGAKGHAWAKVFSRFGWRKVRLSSDNLPGGTEGLSRVKADGDTASKAADPIVVKIAEDRKSSITFWLGILSALTSVVSAVASVMPPK
jgi:hypothetical protein